jgi:hypothetical protein
VLIRGKSGGEAQADLRSWPDPQASERGVSEIGCSGEAV